MLSAECEPICAECAELEYEKLKDYSDQILFKLDEGFSQMLIRKIDEKGLTDSACYHKAGLQRQHFNKIKNDPDYKAKKSTVVALALALELAPDEIDEMLEKAGYVLSNSSKFDLIIKYCIEHNIYKISKVNEMLFAFDQELLGSKM